MDKKTFDEGFKLLKRFLKEKGIYYKVIKFLFKNGRPLENLFDEFNSRKWTDVDDWRKLFNKTNLLTGYLYDFPGEEFEELVVRKGLSRKWHEYYSLNTKLGKEAIRERLKKQKKDVDN